MSPEQIGYLIGVFVGAAVMGGLCGLLPLLMGLKQKRKGLAWASFGVTFVSALILGLLLAAPVALIFTIVLMTTKAEKNVTDVLDDSKGK